MHAMDTSLTVRPHPIGYTTNRLEYAGFLHRTPAGSGERSTRGPAPVLGRASPARVVAVLRLATWVYLMALSVPARQEPRLIFGSRRRPR
jgi:hypothetical protein